MAAAYTLVHPHTPSELLDNLVYVMSSNQLPIRCCTQGCNAKICLTAPLLLVLLLTHTAALGGTCADRTPRHFVHTLSLKRGLEPNCGKEDG